MTSTTDQQVVVYEPHRRGIPPLGPYLRSVWKYRRFAYYLARTGQKARHTDTWFGQLWVVLNPLLLASVYFLLVRILGSQRDLVFIFAGLFTFYYTRNAIGLGAKSIVGGVSVVMQTALPRALLPVSEVISAFLMYIPTLAVYAVFHLVGGKPLGPQLLALPLIVLILTVFNLGLAMLFATMTVYFRDTSAFLPYLLRIWLYLSPVIYAATDVPEQIRRYLTINPLYPVMTSLHQTLFDGRFPDGTLLVTASVWAVAVVLIGGYVFLRKEKEFAVRI